MLSPLSNIRPTYGKQERKQRHGERCLPEHNMQATQNLTKLLALLLLDVELLGIVKDQVHVLVKALQGRTQPRRSAKSTNGDKSCTRRSQ
jgi:hypothetical protein